eukprot:jgi/Tetstr1/443091/TSEL_031147.t1
MTVHSDRNGDLLDEEEEDGAPMNLENDAFDREYFDEFSWEQLQEDEQGHLRPLDRTSEQRKKRQRLLSAAQSARIRRGMIRYMELVIDLSAAASAADMRPNRLSVMVDVAQDFIREFFDQNPLSHLGIVIMRNGVAERLTELSSSPEAHIKELKGTLTAMGQASLQNALDVASGALADVPTYGLREVLILFAGLSTCDPGEISHSIAATKAKKCRVSVLGLAAEVFICKEICDKTGGTYTVALHAEHLHEQMMGHAPPPPSLAASSVARLVRMGFPQRNAEDASGSAFLDSSCELKSGGFTCPKCHARVEELPCECHVCGLTLVSSPHLARSYHHLFPVQPFNEVSGSAEDSQPASSALARDAVMGPDARCYACFMELTHSPAGGDAESIITVVCPQCRNLFCYHCDAFIHEGLHNCPGCECQPGLAYASTVN